MPRLFDDAWINYQEAVADHERVRREAKRALRTGGDPVSCEEATTLRRSVHEAAERRKRSITELGKARHQQPDGD
jgi:hypothetical protein